jgi:hypothetical protein
MNNQKQTGNLSKLADLVGAKEQDEATPAMLADLEASDAKEIKGGPSSGGGTAGKVHVHDISITKLCD